MELQEVPSNVNASIRPPKRQIMGSDDHTFIGRIYDLGGPLHRRMESYEELAVYGDCKYVLDVHAQMTSMVRRVESMNLVGAILWPVPAPIDFNGFPVSSYEWLNIGADVFLMRYVSISDCALLLTNEIYCCGLAPQQCSIENLKKRGVAQGIMDVLKALIIGQGALRMERNARFHHGREREFTDDDITFRLASWLNHYGGGAEGSDEKGRPIDLDRSFNEGLVELQRAFNQAISKLPKILNRLYDNLGAEFESQFSPRFRARAHGFGVCRG